MTADELRALCLSYAGAEETYPFGRVTAVFKVGGKVFALSALDADDLAVSLKVEPLLGESLRASYAGIVPAYHLNKRHWLTARLDGSLDDAMVADLVEDSYDLVVAGLTKARREALPAQAAARPNARRSAPRSPTSRGHTREAR